MTKTINWGYFRNGWTSCKRAQEFLDANQITVNERINASKEKMDADQVWSLVKDAKHIFVAKGKKMMNWNPGNLTLELTVYITQYKGQGRHKDPGHAHGEKGHKPSE